MSLAPARSVNYTEVLIGPLETASAESMDAMFGRFRIETIQVDVALARRAAVVRARTKTA